MYIPDFNELDKLVEQGYLSKKEEGELVLYNYNDKTTFEKYWNEHTINSRGTIYEKKSGKLYSMAFKKFWNLSELSLDEQRDILNQNEFTVMEKADGSMGNVFFHNGKWIVTTRGSFSSDQAIYATNNLLPKYDMRGVPTDHTFIVEIIYPENKIVVDYKGLEELKLLAVFDKQGNEYNGKHYKIFNPFPLVKEYQFNSIQEVIEYTQTLDANNEGFVVRLSTGERFKLKSPEYLKIARILSRMSPLVLWESMVNGKVSQELMESIPEEFRGDYEAYQESLEGSYYTLLEAIGSRYNQVLATLGINSKEDLPEDINSLRKPFALALQSDPNELNSALFGVLLNKPTQVDKFIMESIRPTGNKLNDDA